MTWPGPQAKHHFQAHSPKFWGGGREEGPPWQGGGCGISHCGSYLKQVIRGS